MRCDSANKPGLARAWHFYCCCIPAILVPVTIAVAMRGVKGNRLAIARRQLRLEPRPVLVGPGIERLPRRVRGLGPRLRRQLAITPVGAPSSGRQQPQSRLQVVHVHLRQRRVRQIDRDDCRPASPSTRSPVRSTRMVLPSSSASSAAARSTIRTSLIRTRCAGSSTHPS